MAQEISSGPFAHLYRAWATSPTTASWAADGVLTTSGLPAVGQTSAAQDGYFVFTPHKYTQNPPINLWLMPFGTGTAGQTFDVRVILYHRTQGLSAGWPPPTGITGTTASFLYVPTIACQFTATLGSGAGSSTSADLTNTELLCDQVSATPAVGTAGVDCQPAGVLASSGMGAGYLVDLKAAHAALIRIKISSATAGNVLVGTVNR